MASLGGRHHWETLSSRLFSHLFHIPHIQTVPLFTVQYCYLNTLKLKTYPVLVLRALRLYVCLLLLRVVEARVLLRELRLVAIGFEQVVDVAS